MVLYWRILLKTSILAIWQYGDPVFAYQVGAGAADIIGAQGGMIITLDKVFFSVGVQGGISAFASDGSGNKLYVLNRSLE